MGSRLLDYNPETEGAEGDLLLFGVSTHRPAAQIPNELDELELASTFLDAADTGQLGALANRLLSRGARLAGRPLDPRVAQHLGSRLVSAAKSVRKALAPRAGALSTSDQTEAMERLTGAELEGLSAEDQEFETARYFVRFALEAARTAANARAAYPSDAIAAVAERIAARRFAPGLLADSARNASSGVNVRLKPTKENFHARHRSHPARVHTGSWALPERGIRIPRVRK